LEFRLQAVLAKSHDLPRKRGTPNPDDNFVKDSARILLGTVGRIGNFYKEVGNEW
jgi:hypothetical protein